MSLVPRRPRGIRRGGSVSLAGCVHTKRLVVFTPSTDSSWRSTAGTGMAAPVWLWPCALVARSHKLVARSHKLVARSHKLVARSHELVAMPQSLHP
eukprot:339881-Chlamydomonas_euryale.AAC.1